MNVIVRWIDESIDRSIDDPLIYRIRTESQNENFFFFFDPRKFRADQSINQSVSESINQRNKIPNVVKLATLIQFIKSKNKLNRKGEISVRDRWRIRIGTASPPKKKVCLFVCSVVRSFVFFFFFIRYNSYITFFFFFSFLSLRVTKFKIKKNESCWKRLFLFVCWQQQSYSTTVLSRQHNKTIYPLKFIRQ